ncbi:protease [Candidatus Saccharibacteria bacterium RIFCSPHIGHO2_12_FULL_41_12]|nr:MAG: protease [Candidatus Saccharibacteria bacterium RIFCSPHIGHO2_12_FULL_41_12]
MYSEIASNKRKTFYIFIFFMLVVGVMAWLVSGYLGSTYITPYVLIGCLVYAVITYYSGAKMATAVNGAKQIEKNDNPRLWRIVENLAITDGLPMPKVYIMDDPAPNAFATGRDPNHAIVCATTGLLDMMDDKELQGVMAHELGHVKNYDIRVSMYAFALVAVIAVLADVIMYTFWFRDNDNNNNGIFMIIGIVAAIIAPIVAGMIQMAISRKREYLADADGVLSTRYPEGLASALEKIGKTGSATQKQNTATAHLFFASPLKKRTLTGLFSTHPPIEDRVARIRNMGTKA